MRKEKKHSLKTHELLFFLVEGIRNSQRLEGILVRLREAHWHFNQRTSNRDVFSLGKKHEGEKSEPDVCVDFDLDLIRRTLYLNRSVRVILICYWCYYHFLTILFLNQSKKSLC